MGSEGFEPSKAEPSDLQSDPFDRSGNSPHPELPVGLRQLDCASWIAPVGLRSPPSTGHTLAAPNLRPPPTLRRVRLPLPAWSWRRDLNPQPADYKSAALPIELRQRLGAPPTKTSKYNELIPACNMVWTQGFGFPLPSPTWPCGNTHHTAKTPTSHQVLLTKSTNSPHFDTLQGKDVVWNGTTDYRGNTLASGRK